MFIVLLNSGELQDLNDVINSRDVYYRSYRQHMSHDVIGLNLSLSNLKTISFTTLTRPYKREICVSAQTLDPFLRAYFFVFEAIKLFIQNPSESSHLDFSLD